MGAALPPDALWDLVDRSFPFHHDDRTVEGRASLIERTSPAILFVLSSGIPRQMVPHELGGGSRMTCWRRLRDWQQAGVRDLNHFAMLDWLAGHDQIDWSRAVVDSCSWERYVGESRRVRIQPPGPSEGANAM